MRFSPWTRTVGVAHWQSRVLPKPTINGLNPLYLKFNTDYIVIKKKIEAGIGTLKKSGRKAR